MKITFQLLRFIVAVLSFSFLLFVGTIRVFLAVLGAMSHPEEEDLLENDRTSMQHFMRIPNGYNTDATSGYHDTLLYDDYLDSH